MSNKANTGVCGHENEFVLSKHGFKAGGSDAMSEMNSFKPPNSGNAANMNAVQKERGGFDKGAQRQKSGKRK